MLHLRKRLVRLLSEAVSLELGADDDGVELAKGGD
jgi:hypothetical protein